MIHAQAEQIICVPANTLPGFRNTGDVALLGVSVHASPVGAVGGAPRPVGSSWT